MWKRGANNLAQALLKPINSAAVILLGIYTFVWGLWVINPWWEVFTTAQLYAALIHFPPAYISPEIFFGTIALVCGSFTIWGAVRRSYHSLTIGSSVAFFHWMMIAIFYFIGDWHNTGGITALTFAIYAGFIWLNVRVNKLHGDANNFDMFS